MASCAKAVTMYTHSTSSANSAILTSVVYQPDAVTPLASCGLLMIAPAEYNDLQHGYITTRADAEAIAGGLVLLMAVAFGVKYIRNALYTDDSPSDEKH